MRQLVALTIITFSLTALAGIADAVPRTVSFTGSLSDTNGPVDGAVAMSFRVVDGASTVMWEETHGAVAVSEGLVYVELGSIDPINNGLDAGVFTGAPMFLEVTIDGQPLTPRVPLLSVPYATRAEVADRLGDLEPGDVATASHDHDGVYAPATHDHDSRYDSRYAGISHDHSGVYATVSHNHNSQYASLSHNHSGVYATVSHNHNSQYASLSHNHSGVYLPVGTTRSCPSGQRVTAISTTGNVSCATDVDTNTTYSAGTGLSMSGTTISIAASGVTRSRIQGTEIAVYQSDADCASELSLTSTCKSRMCLANTIAGPVPGHMDCSGVCKAGQINPSTCDNSLKGYLLSTSS